jgi:uncharacterized SAM-binding protein YcdF (DUF218 family)
MFLLKKIVAPLFFPVSLCLELLLLGLFLLWFTRKQKTGKIIVSIGVILLCTLSYGAVSDILLQPLEYKYPPLIKLEDVHDIKWVVVLGGGHTSDPKLSVISQLSEASLCRLVEGIRLHRELPKSKLVLSGGSFFDRVSNAKVLSEVAVAIGVKKKNILLEEISKDTEDQARLIQQIVSKDRFILITSASHMPRTMAFFRRLGMDPLPAPTEYLVKESVAITPERFYPSAGGLRKTERAFYEYLGLAWAKLRGLI